MPSRVSTVALASLMLACPSGPKTTQVPFHGLEVSVPSSWAGTVDIAKPDITFLNLTTANEPALLACQFAVVHDLSREIEPILEGNLKAMSPTDLGEVSLPTVFGPCVGHTFRTKLKDGARAVGTLCGLVSPVGVLTMTSLVSDVPDQPAATRAAVGAPCTSLIRTLKQATTR